ncbi:HdeD family acid-resistance protein [Sulfitobacter sp. F26169L]|uniref:HdeD family acid-resistance protein n=1 Tax=Sulfitobacter sp. F26169L TaxID=2996015 RepID=UPI0022608F5E|nr:HdeD family acid-resistance protein [Sulfitobacter sp. F26169L]MCX7564991.1 HdeD family acid-resistance protein [Sulfitobacter sp. F26169L]
MNTSTDMENAMNFLTRNWWLLLLRGIAAILFGLATFVWPGLTISVLIIMFGAYILLDGIIGVVDALRYREGVDNWWFWLFESILGIVVGLLTLFMPGITALVLLMFVAAWSILGGVLRIVAAIQLRKKIEGEWIMVLSGVLSIVFGVAIIALPHAGLVSIAWLIGFWAIAFGILFIMLAFRLRKAGG